MEKILTKEEKNKKIKRNQLILGIILILIMVLSTVGYAIGTKEEDNNNQKISYNGVDFKKESDYWRFNVQGYDFITRYNPRETENVSFQGFFYLSLNDYANEPLYFVEDYQGAGFELKRNLYSFALRIQDACSDNLNCSGDLPVKNCLSDNIIIIQEPEDSKEKIYQENKCAFISANSENQTIYADAFLFKILKIKP